MTLYPTSAKEFIDIIQKYNSEIKNGSIDVNFNASWIDELPETIQLFHLNFNTRSQSDEEGFAEKSRYSSVLRKVMESNPKGVARNENLTPELTELLLLSKYKDYLTYNPRVSNTILEKIASSSSEYWALVNIINHPGASESTKKIALPKLESLISYKNNIEQESLFHMVALISNPEILFYILEKIVDKSKKNRVLENALRRIAENPKANLKCLQYLYTHLPEDIDILKSIEKHPNTSSDLMQSVRKSLGMKRLESANQAVAEREIFNQEKAQKEREENRRLLPSRILGISRKIYKFSAILTLIALVIGFFTGFFVIFGIFLVVSIISLITSMVMQHTNYG